VLAEEDIRDYSNGTRSYNDVDTSPSMQDSSPGSVLYSPVKIGDSFENLKRKMQPFPGFKQQLVFADDDAADKCIEGDLAEGDTNTLTYPAAAAASSEPETAIQTEVPSNTSPAPDAPASSVGGDETIASPVPAVTVALSASGLLEIVACSSSDDVHGSDSNNNNNMSRMSPSSSNALGANVGAVEEEQPPLLVLEQPPLVLVQQ
jgi:hypothetical protein